MTAKKETDVTEEAIVEEQVEETPTEETTEETPTEEEVKETPAEDTPEDNTEHTSVEQTAKDNERVKNLRLIAKAKTRLERENQKLEQEKLEMAAKIAAFEETQKRYNDDYGLDDEKKEVQAKKDTQLQQQIYKQQQQMMNQMAMDKAEIKILKKHSDFPDVVDDVNVSILKEVDPELTKKIIMEEDIYLKAIMTYDGIRKNGIYRAANEAATNKEAIIKNMSKPKAAVSTTTAGAESASVFADIHSRDYQNQLRRELEESRKKV